MLSALPQVGAKLKNKLVEDTSSGQFISSSLTITSNDIAITTPNFPCLYVKPIGEPTEKSDFQNNQLYIESTVELQSYVSLTETKGLTLSKTIIDKAGNVMLSMGYQLVSGPYPMNGDYYRQVARFKRVVGNGETL